MSLYAKRGVSAQKEEVHAATKNLDKGLYPRAFCKIYPDVLGGDDAWVNVMHADGAGTKSILAYLYWRETGDVSVWKGIAQDAIVMNTDDLLCVGITDKLLYSSSIDRNKSRIPAEVLQALIDGSQEFFDTMRQHHVDITFMGGETADVGDVVRTVAVNGTMTARWPKAKLVTNEGIAPGQVIVGFSSYGQSVYENEYNSGIGSNGLTSARHDVLHKKYKLDYPESLDEGMDDAVAYIGKHSVADPVSIQYRDKNFDVPAGKLLLSPTRTFAPLAKRILSEQFDAVKGMIHCSGGGQTKCMKYMPDGVQVIKDNLIAAPEIFRLIQQSSGADAREMYQVFNMGCRLEIYTEESAAAQMIATANSLGIEAQIIGRVAAGTGQSLVVNNGSEEIVYQF